MSERKDKGRTPASGLFATIRRYRRLQKRRFPFLKSVLDFDLLLEIGRYQERDRTITTKQLFLAHLGPAATVQRRLARLKTLGVVRQTRSERDQRVMRLTLDPAILRKLERVARVRARRA